MQPGEASWTVDSLVELAILHQPCMRAAASKPTCPPVSVGVAKPLAGAIRTPLASQTASACHLFDWQNVHRIPNGKQPNL